MSISCGFIILKAHYRVGMLIKNMIGEDIKYGAHKKIRPEHPVMEIRNEKG